MGMERYKVRVKDGEAVGGILKETGQRIQVMPGTYTVHWLTWFSRDGSDEGRLRFIGAGPDGKDLDLRRDDYPELQQWPPAASSRFEYLGPEADA